MKPIRKLAAAGLFSLLMLCTATAHASAYNGNPKLLVVIVIDQFRGDYLARGHEQFGQGGFRLFTDKGAWFTDCNYQYANTRTAPGHATLFTGAYSNGHGIYDNEIWNDSLQRVIEAVQDDSVKLLGGAPGEIGVSPRSLLADTFGDELRMATNGKSRVFAVSLKDRGAVLPGGYSGIAYWINRVSGAWVTSDYYMKALPDWVVAYNRAGHAEQYWDREWKVGGKVLRATKRPATFTNKENYFEIVGATPFANDLELEFARALIEHEKLGQGPTTDMLVISLSANDILTHKVGPNSEQSQAMVQALDSQLSGFFAYLDKTFGLGNVWMALSADHGVGNAPSYVKDLRIPAVYLGKEQLRGKLNAELRSRLKPSGKNAGETVYVPTIDWPLVLLNAKAFTDAGVKEDDAERMVAEFFKPQSRGYYTRVQLAAGQVPPNAIGQRYLNSLSPNAGWLVYMVTPPFVAGGTSGADHGVPYSYDMHVPLAFYGTAFKPSIYRGRCETVDMAVTLANLLGINSPSAAAGRVLTEALKASGGSETKR